MPTYEYECNRCGHAFERFQSMTDKPVRTCPACKGRSVRRLIGTGAAIIFKGSGFYQTDYRSESYKAGEKTAKPKTEAETKTSDKKDTKKTDASKAKGATTKTPAKSHKE